MVIAHRYGHPAAGRNEVYVLYNFLEGGVFVLQSAGP